MPIYEYRCTSCGFQKEYLQKMDAALLTDCPECGKQSLTKMVTAAGFQLKGSGWYATDFKPAVKPKTESKDKPAAKGDEKSAATSATTSESKPATEAAVTKSDSAKTTATSGAGTGTT